MKIVITSKGNSLNSVFDTRFGRCDWFCIFDKQNHEFKFVENRNSRVDSGAGLKAAEMVAEFGVGKVISGHFGPKAKNMLDRLNIEAMALERSNITIEEVLKEVKTDFK